MTLNADARRIPLADQSVHCVITSPPYYRLRSYGHYYMQQLWGSLDDFCLPKQPKKRVRWWILIRWRAAEKGGVFSPNKQSWIGALGLEPTPDMYINHMVEVFREVWRVLRDDGTLWLNIGDSYNGSGKGGVFSTASAKQAANKGANIGLPTRIPTLKPKDLIMIPARLALALQQPFLRCKNCDAVAHRSKWGHYPNGRPICPNCEKSKGYTVEQPGWYVRSDIIWSKPNPMPESVTDRPTRSHEYVFLLTKSAKYCYDAGAIKEPYTSPMNRWGGEKLVARGKSDWDNGTGQSTYRDRNMRSDPNGRNRRSVWTIATQPTPFAHFATFPEKLVEPCILAGTSERGRCPKCDRRWVRVVERTMPPKEVFTNTRKPKDGLVGGSNKDGEWVGSGQKLQDWLNEHPAQMVGWRPSCNHYPRVDEWQEHPEQDEDETDEQYLQRCKIIRELRLELLDFWRGMETMPDIVLDPFAGSGTVERAAIRLGRRAVGCELSFKYIDEVARKRLLGAQIELSI